MYTHVYAGISLKTYKGKQQQGFIFQGHSFKWFILTSAVAVLNISNAAADVKCLQLYLIVVFDNDTYILCTQIFVSRKIRQKLYLTIKLSLYFVTMLAQFLQYLIM